MERLKDDKNHYSFELGPTVMVRPRKCRDSSAERTPSEGGRRRFESCSRHYSKRENIDIEDAHARCVCGIVINKHIITRWHCRAMRMPREGKRSLRFGAVGSCHAKEAMLIA